MHVSPDYGIQAFGGRDMLLYREGRLQKGQASQLLPIQCNMAFSHTEPTCRKKIYTIGVEDKVSSTGHPVRQ